MFYVKTGLFHVCFRVASEDTLKARPTPSRADAELGTCGFGDLGGTWCGRWWGDCVEEHLSLGAKDYNKYGLTK